MLLALFLCVLTLTRVFAPDLAANPLACGLLWAAQVSALARSADVFAARLLGPAPRTARWTATFLLYETGAGSISTLTAMLGGTNWLSNALATLVVWLVARGVRTTAPQGPCPPPTLTGTSVERASLGFALGLAIGGLATVHWIAWRGTVQNSDAMWYHLPFVAEWLRSGDLQPAALVPTIARAYPFLRAGAVVYHSLPFGTEHLGLLGPGELGALMLACAALGRALGLAQAAAAVLAAWMVAYPIAARAAPMEGTDVWLGFAFLASLLFGLRSLKGRAAGDCALFGIALGALAAAKYSGLILAFGCASLYALAMLLEVRRGRPISSRALLACLAGVCLVGAPSYLRNYFYYANPLWPARIAPFGYLLWDGPYGREYFRAQTLGFAFGPLLEHLRFFRQAFGWTVLLPVSAPLVVLVAWRRGRLAPGRALLYAGLPILLFLTWLQQPFSRPAANYIFTMRFLLPWAACSTLLAYHALERALGERARSALAAVFGVVALLPLHQWTQQWWLSAVLGIAAALLAYALPEPSQRACREALRSRIRPHATLAGALAVVFLGQGAVGLERFRQRQQYHPHYGYRDNESDRGWGAIVRYVHEKVSAKRVAFHGAGTFFPLYGDRLTNELHALPIDHDAATALAYCEAHQIDYLACFVPSYRLNFNGPFQYGRSLLPEIRRLRPECEIVVHDAGAALLRLRP